LRRTGGAGRRSIAQRGRQISDRAYVVTADFGPAPAATLENPRPRPAIISGTFRVIVIGR
jgi:hypothetical protein